MTRTIGSDDLRATTIRTVAQLMAAAAITAPKSGGQLFLAGKPGFMETVIAGDPATRRQLAQWMRARGKERRERIWFRDAEVAEAVDAILFVGLLPGWYPPNYDCGACGWPARCSRWRWAPRWWWPGRSGPGTTSRCGSGPAAWAGDHAPARASPEPPARHIPGHRADERPRSSLRGEWSPDGD